MAVALCAEPTLLQRTNKRTPLVCVQGGLCLHHVLGTSPVTGQTDVLVEQEKG